LLTGCLRGHNTGRGFPRRRASLRELKSKKRKWGKKILDEKFRVVYLFSYITALSLNSFLSFLLESFVRMCEIQSEIERVTSKKRSFIFKKLTHLNYEINI